MTDPTTTPTPPEVLTDERLLELMPQRLQDDLAAASELFAQNAKENIGAFRCRVLLNTAAVAYARAAIAADRAARPAPTPEEIEAQFRAWWAESYPHAPVGNHAVGTHVAFALHLLGGEVAA